MRFKNCYHYNNLIMKWRERFKMSYASFSIFALVCYIYLFLALLASQKNRLIFSFLILLVDMILWTGGSFAMRMCFGPSTSFWFDVSLIGLIFMPYVFYNFISEFIGKKDEKIRRFWLYISIILNVLNYTTHVFLEAPEMIMLHNDVVFIYHFTWHIYIVIGICIICALQIVYNVYCCVKNGDRMLYQFTPILAGISILLLGHGLIMLDIFKGIPLDILSGIINALLLFYALYKKHLFNLKLLVSKRNCYAISAIITILLFSNYLVPLRNFIAQHFSYYLDPMILVFIIFMFVFVCIQTLLKRFIDQIFIKEEKQQADYLKSFSDHVRNTLSVYEIAQDICEIITETLGVHRVYVCMQEGNHQDYHIIYGNASLERQNFTFQVDNPIVEELKEKKDCLLYDDFKRSLNYRSMWENEKQLLEHLQIECIVPLIEDELIGMVLLTKKLKNQYTYEDMKFLSSVASISTIALKNSRLYEMVYQEAISDEMTGLLNRKYFYKQFEELFTQKGKECTLTLILFSLDDVRLYNQLYGTKEGDKAIMKAAQIMQKTMPDTAIISRLSGKEFAILLPECSLQTARDLAENVRYQLANANNDQDDFALRSVTGSFGIASIPLLASNPKQLEEYANQALYQAKRRGKNQVVIYNEETKSSMQTQKDSKDKENIYSEYAEMIYALTATIDTKDHYTFTHSKNVAYYACELAYAIGLKEDVVEIIREAALLHDIGKIGIREDILNKQGKLTSEEYEIMKGHVENSIGIIRYLPSLDYVIPVVISHHERWDGRGYPRGISKEDIPIGGRILCVADSFDAMTSKRSYKESFTLEYAIKELKNQAGKQFDPQLAEVFVRLLESGHIKLQVEQREKNHSTD